MNSTKRKFNALLNSIGNKSTTSLSSLEDDDEMARSSSLDRILKKQKTTTAGTRIAIANSSFTAPTKSIYVHKKSLSHANVANVAKVATTGLTKVEPPAPKYAPWDRAAFLERLRSFSDLLSWMPKPDRVNEVEWAKRGWVLQKSERVRCCLCNREVVVKVNEKEVNGTITKVYNTTIIDKALVDKYAELIVTGHDENCMWRQKGCDDTIHKLPLNGATVILRDIHERYGQLCTRTNTLPYEFNLRLPASFDFDAVMSYLPKKFFTNISNPSDPNPPPGMPEINRVALKLALFGWQGHSVPRKGNDADAITCKACFRVLGLWLFKSKEVSPEGKEIVPATMLFLDVITEHRSYCPWRNPVSQNGHGKSSTSNMAGWEIVQKVLKNEYYLRHGGDISRPTTAGSSTTGVSGVSLIEQEDDDEEVGMAAREEKDKERWARLRRVKSLFDTKGMKKAAAKGDMKDIPAPSAAKKVLQVLDEQSKKMRATRAEMDKNKQAMVRMVTEKDQAA